MASSVEKDFEVLLKTEKKSLEELLFSYFIIQSNVHSYALDLLDCCSHFYTKNMEVTFSIVSSLQKFCKQQKISCHITFTIKRRALDICVKIPVKSVVQKLCDIFKFKDDYEYVLYLLKELLYQKRFHEAYPIMTALDAEEDIELEEFAYPALFMGERKWILNYLDKVPWRKLKYLQKLDYVSRSNKSILDFVRSLPIKGIDTSTDFCSQVKVQKTIAKFADEFEFDIKQFQNLYQGRCSRAMIYLVRKRYNEKTSTAEAFEELVKDVVENNRGLQIVLLKKLIAVKDVPTAIKFAKDFNIDRADWPLTLQNWLVSNYSGAHTSTSSVAANKNLVLNVTSCDKQSDKKDYLVLELDRSDIHFLDTPDAINAAIRHIAKNYDVVAIDAEWKPNLGFSKEVISICQLAVKDSVYLIDVFNLKNHPDSNSLSYLFEKIFYSDKIWKLGFGALHDLKMMIPASGDTKSKPLCNVIDFLKFFHDIEQKYPDVMSKLNIGKDKQDPLLKGLALLCRKVLGKAMNKDEQFSNWERRPLREAQITYAALDAYCLLLIHDKLVNVLKELDLKLADVLATCSNSEKKSEVPGKSEMSLSFHKKGSSESGAPRLPPKPVREQARVIYPYVAMNEDELSLKEGDIITVISKEVEDKGWWKGELNSRTGVFPDNFVQLIKVEKDSETPSASKKQYKPLKNGTKTSKSPSKK